MRRHSIFFHNKDTHIAFIHLLYKLKRNFLAEQHREDSLICEISRRVTNIMHYFIAVRNNNENLIDSSLDLKTTLNFCRGIQCNYQLPYAWFMHSDITSTISLLIKNTNKLKKPYFIF